MCADFEILKGIYLIKITVVTAVYNRRETLTQALDSIIAQSYPSVELIVIDGASTDGSLEILERYKQFFGAFISERDDGIYDALNKGIKSATGDVIGFLHADDVLQNTEVLSKVAAIFSDPTVDAVYGDLVYVARNNINHVLRYWPGGIYNDKSFQRGWMPPHPTFYVRRSIFDRLGGFDTRYRIAADYDLVLRFLAVEKIHSIYIPEVMVRMRVGGISNQSLKSILRKSLEDFVILRRNNVGGIRTLLTKNIRKVSQFWGCKIL
jgi:glycosyltransferase involved in cell wall biosynthesis